MSAHRHPKTPLRFLRSAHLERDFYDPEALNSYVLTDVATECLVRISQGLKPGSGQRSWRIVGDYGSGKSSFALLLAHWFFGKVGSLPKRIAAPLAYESLNVAKPQLVPVLVTGSREPLSSTIRRGITDAINHHYPSGFGKGRNNITKLLKQNSLSDVEVLELLFVFGERIRADRKGKGLLLIIDEMGKSLEFAASSASESDVFLLQRLAEEASRSADSPFFIIGILHQGFGAYASSLGLTAKQEWEKVAGRYDEVVFQHPMEQTAALISEALSVREEDLRTDQVNSAKSAMKATLDQGWYGASANKKSLEFLAPKLYPLDPTVLPLLSRVLHRFGQNQRSIFSFLFGNEANALQAYLATNQNQPYRTCHLYDYIHANLGHHLALAHTLTHWTTIDAMVSSYITDNLLYERIIKTVGVFNLLNSSDLRASAEVVSLCLSGKKNDKTILKAVSELQSDFGKRVLFDRGNAGGLCLWPHISADLQKAQEVAEGMIGSLTSPAEFIKTHLDNTNLVARRHYIETGTLRYFPLIFCKPSDLSDPHNFLNTTSDGIALTPLCLNSEDVNEATRRAQSSIYQALSNIIIIIPGKLQGLTPLIREVQVWEWIATNTPELNGDRYARETVSRKRVSAEQALEQAIGNAVGFDQSAGAFNLKCFWKGDSLNVSSGKQLLSKLSNICDELYNKSPKVNNELINRQNISSAAAGARMRLIERVLEHPDEPYLGMDESKKPPEMSMYMSVLKAGNVHVISGDSANFVIPGSQADCMRLKPTLEYLKNILMEDVDTPIGVDVILQKLRAAPYGVRDGISPLLITVFYSVFKRNIAIYENGTFLSSLTGAEFLRLTKRPETFQLQYCDVSGLRANAFEHLADVLKIKRATQEPELLDVVRPLCILVANLPPYSRKTKSLSKSTVAVRDALMDARDPLKLLFELLPMACECEPIAPNSGSKSNTDKFIKHLDACIDELQGAYNSLLDRIKHELIEKFGSNKRKAESFRGDIAKRAETLFPYVTEKELKAFCYRLQEKRQTTEQWLNSVASVVVYKPADKWTDPDEDKFRQHLPELTSRFIRTEGVAFGRDTAANNPSMRLCVTKPNGEEKIQVLTLNPEDEVKVRTLEDKIAKIIDENGEVALLATSNALWNNLKG